MTASVPGSVRLQSGSRDGAISELSVSPFPSTPTDNVACATATDSIAMSITGRPLTITWPTPATVTYGTPLSSTQLSATASVPGSIGIFASGRPVEPAGSDKLSVTFTEKKTTDYSKMTASVTLQVNPATPVIGKMTPAAITFRKLAVLSSTPLRQTMGPASAGTLVYSPGKSAALTSRKSNVRRWTTPLIRQTKPPRAR